MIPIIAKPTIAARLRFMRRQASAQSEAPDGTFASGVLGV
jgi:hypothetical protein